jgi:hypothetical protein
VLLDKETLLTSDFEGVDLAQQRIGRTVQSVNLPLKGCVPFGVGNKLRTKQKHRHLTSPPQVVGEKAPAMRYISEIRNDSVPLREQAYRSLRAKSGR